ncbi:MAG: tetratricopeptide repeat protein [Bdellovibrionales bacterium]
MNDMSEHSLLQEIEEDLARQKYEKLWQKYGPYILGAIVLIVAATAGWSGYKSYRLESAQSTTESYVSMILQQDESEKDLAVELQEYSAAHEGTTQSVFARIKAGAENVKAGKEEEAVKIYDALAADKTVDKNFRELADLLSVQTQMDKGDGAALQARLEPLMKPECIWRFTAKEYAGYLAIRLGDKEKAKKLFTELKDEKGAPGSISARAADVASWLSEGA